MKVEIITIGDELLWGQTADHNAAFLGRRLVEMGLAPEWVTTVGDNPQAIKQALTLALTRAGLILITGGLGPTEDDVTRRAVGQALGRHLVLEEGVLEDIRARLERRGQKIAVGQQSLALLPQGAKVLNNPQGLAPGLMLKADHTLIFILPGVPREMRAIFEETVKPSLREISTEGGIRQRRLRTVGIGESALQERLQGTFVEGIKVAYVPGPWSVDLWLTAHSTSTQAAETLLAQGTRRMEERLEGLVYGVDQDTMERVVAALLIMRGSTIAVAESCTGGLVANRLTDVPGSSAYFERGIIAYSNQAKREVLKVPKRTLDRFGAVSRETATAMAEGVRKISGTNLGLSTTGIAGPTGATVEKPVGLAFIGLAHRGGSFAHRFLFGQDRRANKECCLMAALNLVRQYLLRL
jgi:nicotinamide-nucleotide amidase